MKLFGISFASFATALCLPLVASADAGGVPLDASGGLITVGYYLSALGFLIATTMMGLAIKRFGSSAVATIFSYFFVGTGTFFIITIFQTLGGSFFGIADTSMDIWWHIMFYMALTSYYIGLQGLVQLGNGNMESMILRRGSEKMWGALYLILLAIIFAIPHTVDGIIQAYSASMLSEFGLHHFIAFLLAALVGWYLYTARENLGQIGKAISAPMLLAIVALGAQHFWELLNESWKVVQVTSQVGEGVEKIFLIIAAIGVTYAAWKLRSYSLK